MYTEKFEQILEKREGCDINVTVYLMRHPHKESYTGDISPQGVKDAEELKRLFNRAQKIFNTDSRELRHSGQKRARRAAMILSPEDDGQNKLRGKLNVQEDVREGLWFTGSDEFEKKYKELTKVNQGNEAAAVQMTINTGDQRYDPETLSSAEISRNVAKELLEIVEETKNYEFGTKKPILLISHSGVIENFLVDLLGKREEKSSLSAIGGPLDFLEDLRLYIHRKTPTEASLKYRFRKWQGELTEKKLKQLASAEK